jgi:hypothetical protein
MSHSVQKKSFLKIQYYPELNRVWNKILDICLDLFREICLEQFWINFDEQIFFNILIEIRHRKMCFFWDCMDCHKLKLSEYDFFNLETYFVSYLEPPITTHWGINCIANVRPTTESLTEIKFYFRIFKKV